MAHSILVNRLRSRYWPKWMNAFTLAEVTRAKPQPHWDRPTIRTHTDIDDWDLGRAHWFMLKMRKGEHVDPISIETHAWPGPISAPPAWSGPIVDDGHHRLAAAVLFKRRRMLTTFSGPLVLLHWLQGTTRRYPFE